MELLNNETGYKTSTLLIKLLYLHVAYLLHGAGHSLKNE